MLWAGVIIHPQPVLRPDQAQGFSPDWLTRWSAVRWIGAGWSPGTRNFLTIRVHAPAEAGATVALQWQEVALLITLGDVDPGAGVGVLSLGRTLLTFASFQS